MAHGRLHWVILLLSICTIRADNIVILPLSSYFCHDEPAIEYDINLRNVNGDGEKVLDFNITLEEKFTEKWMFVLKIDKWNNGAWDENFYNAEGPACQIVDQYVSRAWQNLRDAMDPLIPGYCTIEPANYKLKDFEVNRMDYDIPVTILGRYRVTGRVLNEEGVELVCQVIEVETDKKG